MIRRPPRSTLFPPRRSSDPAVAIALASATGAEHRRWQEAATREGDRYGIDPAYVRAALAGESASVSPSRRAPRGRDRKSTRLNSSHGYISYAVFCLKKKKNT